MPIRLIDPDVAMAWTHPDEEGDPEAMTFHILPFREKQVRKLAASNAAEGQIDPMDLFEEFFLSNVQDIANVKMPGEDGRVKVESQEDKTRFLACLPMRFKPAIFKAIIETGDLTTAESKNSDGSSDSETSSPMPSE
jgi:hypothetical protein